MTLKYINKIKANVSIFTNKKSTNILDGTYRSIYKGKSLNFDNLRDYVIGDDVKDVDWKSSARSGKLLVKQFVADKKHNILLVMDNGIKMDADTDKHENKKSVALFSAGTVGYLALQNNDYAGMIYSSNNKVVFNNFRSNIYNLEEYLLNFESASYEGALNLNDVLRYVYKNISKKMIIFVITDIDGINNIDTRILKQLKQMNEVLFININDNYMYGESIFDVSKDSYIPSFLSNDVELNNLEKNIKSDLIKENTLKLKRYNISMTSISSVLDINNSIIDLLEEHKNAGRN